MDIMKVKNEQGNWVTVPAFQGQLGKTPSFSIGRVDLGTTPSSAAATITGTDEEPVLNLVLPKGINGNTGPTGIAVQDTEPSEQLAWIDTSSTGNLVSIPEVKDNTVSATDTWSSAKIRDFASPKDNITSSTTTWSSEKIRDFIYPVGSIYLSVNNVNPSTIFGGTWEQIQDTFLLAAGSTYAAGDTGGEAEHTLDIQEMPKHIHDVGAFKDGGSYGAYGSSNYGASVTRRSSGGKINNTWVNGAFNTFGSMYSIDGVNIGTGDPVGLTSWSGNSQPHNNMPPYLAVYMWKRLS